MTTPGHLLHDVERRPDHGAVLAQRRRRCGTRTGCSADPSSDSTRYSRTTSCAVGSSGPAGGRRRTYDAIACAAPGTSGCCAPRPAAPPARRRRTGPAVGSHPASAAAGTQLLRRGHPPILGVPRAAPRPAAAAPRGRASAQRPRPESDPVPTDLANATGSSGTTSAASSRPSGSPAASPRASALRPAACAEAPRVEHDARSVGTAPGRRPASSASSCQPRTRRVTPTTSALPTMTRTSADSSVTSVAALRRATTASYDSSSSSSRQKPQSTTVTSATDRQTARPVAGSAPAAPASGRRG